MSYLWILWLLMVIISFGIGFGVGNYQASWFNEKLDENLMELKEIRSKKDLNSEEVQLVLQKHYNDVKRDIEQNRQDSISEREFVTSVCADEKAYLLERISEELRVDIE